jgi:hypothetical protein
LNDSRENAFAVERQAGVSSVAQIAPS